MKKNLIDGAQLLPEALLPALKKPVALVHDEPFHTARGVNFKSIWQKWKFYTKAEVYHQMKKFSPYSRIKLLHLVINFYFAIKLRGRS